jgi:hypothetical protein
MSLAIGLLMILTGLAIMAFGLFMFYAWLPLFYALIGFDVGILLGRAFTEDVGTTAIVSRNCWRVYSWCRVLCT